MDRRAFVGTVAIGLFAAPLPAGAQQAGRMYRIAFLGSTSPSGYASQVAAFRGGLRDLGYVEGRNLVIEFRWAQGNYERLPELASELVQSKPDVLVTHGPPGALAAKRATDAIPIVLGEIGVEVEIGVVESLARPGGNVTGLSFFVLELNAKRLELLKEAVPRLGRVGVLLKRDNPGNKPVLRAMEDAAQTLKLQLQPIEVRDPADLESAVSTLRKGHADAGGGYADCRGRQDRRPCAKAPTPPGRLRRVRQGRWSIGLRGELPGSLAPGGGCRGQDLQGRQASRSARRAGHEVRAGREREDREGPWPHHPALAAGAGGPDHRVGE
jgi:hypothetical protein